jgi:L-lactate dehydrogenase (cytochrome)
VYVDSGVRSGGDVVAALGFGATAVMVGRPYLYGLMVAGQKGVDAALDILVEDMRRAMCLLGAGSIEEITRDHVHLRDR